MEGNIHLKCRASLLLYVYYTIYTMTGMWLTSVGSMLYVQKEFNELCYQALW